MTVEAYVAHQALDRYEVTRIYDNHAALDGNQITVSDALGVQDVGDETWAPITITINGREYSHPSLVRIRPNHTDENRYHGSVALAVLRDKLSGSEHLGVIQYLHDPDKQHFDFQARLLLVSSDGAIDEDIFWHSQRTTPPYRYMFMYAATMAATGFVYRELYMWPSLFYPFVFPLGTGASGFGLLLVGGVAYLRRALRAEQPAAPDAPKGAARG